MRKNLFSSAKISLLIVQLCGLLLIPGLSSAQCGANSFPAVGGVLTPTGTWQNVSMGSGTYVDFTGVVGNIYSFRYTQGTAPVTGNAWDMTISSGSTPLGYNNSLSPVRDSWTGGQGCPNTSRPGSGEYVATTTGVIRINTASYGPGCNGFVAGEGSAILQYKTCTPPADPGPGTNAWTVEAFATTDISIPNPDARYGSYINNNLNFVTNPFWAPASNPSTASSWVGCEMPNDNFTIRARRIGFPCGVYQIFVNNADDRIRIYVNGALIAGPAGPVGSGTQYGDPNGYLLSSTDQVEIRMAGFCGNDFANVSFVPQGVSAVDGGFIGGIPNNADLCQGSPLGQFLNLLDASGGTSGATNGGLTYSWEFSSDGGASFNVINGVTTASWNMTTPLPVSGIYVVRRVATDPCGNLGYSNTITINIRDQPNASLTAAAAKVCPGACTYLYPVLSPGSEPFDVTISDGINPPFTVTGLFNGDSIQVCPTVTPSTTYQFVSVTDVFGCNRTSGFTSGAVVNINPDILINNVAVSHVKCFGTSTGSLTVLVTGGTPQYNFSVDGGATFTTNFNNVVSGLDTGEYNLVVVDAFGCTQTYGANPIIITEPTPLVFDSLTKTDPSCNGVFDGLLSAYGSGGTPPYRYSLNFGPLQPSRNFAGVQAGCYQVDIYDANDCVVSDTICLVNTYLVGMNVVSKTDLTCFGSQDGCASVELVGGVQPYEYSLNGVVYVPSDSFCGLAAGTHTILGRDAKGCANSVTVTIVQPTPVVITLDSVVNVLCHGNSTGGIYVSVRGGTPGYTYLWNPGSVTTEDLTGVTAGAYNINVLDTNGCAATLNAVVTQPLELFLNIASYNNLYCTADSSGAVDVTANGGVPPYTYSWSSVSGYTSSSEDINHLPADTYTVTVTDANGCQKDITQVVTEPILISSGVVGTNVTCNGARNGAADLSPTGGTPPYTYAWSPGPASEDISGLNGGIYFVTITDFNGCRHRDSVVIFEPDPLVLTTVVTQISCFNANDGAIDLTVTGGTQPYTYVWNPGQLPTQDLSGLGAATYVVIVTDSNGCTATTSAIIVNPLSLTVNIVVTSAQCFGDTNGAIDLQPFGGTPGYTFQWNNGQPATEDLFNVPAGVYMVTISDSRNCSITATTTVTEPGILYTSGFITNVSCNGFCDGFIDITAYGGTLPYAFNWSDSSSTEDIGKLCGGSYNVTVTDGHGCLAATLYPVLEPPVLLVDVVGNNVSCNGGSNGNVAAVPSGGIKPYEYIWYTPLGTFTDSALYNVVPGRYVVELYDSARYCHTFDTLYITEPSKIEVTLDSIVNVACYGSLTGAVHISVSGGVFPYSYAWSPSGSIAEDITGVGGGLHTVTITDATGCTLLASFNVAQPEGIYSTLSIQNPICLGATNGSITLDVTGGTIPYYYDWSTTPVQHGNNLFNVGAGNYTVTITDAHNCTAIVGGTLTDPAALVVTANAEDARCYNTATGFVTAIVTGGTPPYIYSLNAVVQSQDTFFNLPPGNYVLAVEDANGCKGTDDFKVSSPSQLTVDLTAPQTVILDGMQAQLIATSITSAGTIINHTWSPMDSLNLFDFSACGDPNNCANPWVTPHFTTTFMVTVMNSDSCTASDTITIVVEPDQKAYIPSAFTPNGDGLNDLFQFDILGATTVDIVIYSRWGEQVYANQAQPNGYGAANGGWDGTKDGKALAYDTYVYRMKVSYYPTVSKEPRERSGTISIVK